MGLAREVAAVVRVRSQPTCRGVGVFAAGQAVMVAAGVLAGRQGSASGVLTGFLLLALQPLIIAVAGTALMPRGV